MISKGRLDALSDGIFAFAMTLLVLDLRLPDGFAPQNAQQLLDGLLTLGDNLIAYVISFAVLALRWFSQARVHSGAEETTSGFGRLTLLYLFTITCVPFSTMVVGRYGELAPAVWLYGANMIASSAIAWVMMVLARAEGRRGSRGSNVGSAILLASAVLSVAISFVAPRCAMDAYFLNLLAPVIRLRRGAPET